MEIYSLLEESDINQVIPNIYLQIVLDLMRAQCRGIWYFCGSDKEQRAWDLKDE